MNRTITAYVELDAGGDLAVCEMNGTGLAWLPASFFVGNGIYDEDARPFFGHDSESAHVTRILSELLARSGYTCNIHRLYGIIQRLMVPGPARHDEDPADYHITLTSIVDYEVVPAVA